MQNQIIIALASGVITLIASLLLATYKARVEFKKLAQQLEEKYTTSLFEKRFLVYPQLFKLLTELNNTIERGEESRKKLLALRTGFSAWMAENALFLTPKTAGVTWGYHAYLLDLEKNSETISRKKWLEIYELQKTIGKFLRAEIGVFDTKAAGAAQLEKPYIQKQLALLKAAASKARQSR